MSDQDSTAPAAVDGPEAAADQAGPGQDQSSLPALIMALVALLVSVDIVLDWDNGADLVHVATEVLAMSIATGGAVVLWWRLQSARRHARRLSRDLVVARADADRLRTDLARFRTESQEYARGLGEAIDRQFERWGLTPAEREVALLLVKGLSHKEAADVRATSERTVRQQALAVYRKAGLAGRAELAAFFLEDLLQAPAAAPGRSAAEGR